MYHLDLATRYDMTTSKKQIHFVVPWQRYHINSVKRYNSISCFNILLNIAIRGILKNLKYKDFGTDVWISIIKDKYFYD